MNKFVFFILTSSNHKLLKVCYNTVINQKNHNIDYDIIIVVNSLNSNYINDVINEFQNIDVEIIQTQSNGKPGMGHNSLINIFNNRPIYDYMLMIDGDDFLYPYAFHQLSKIIHSKNPDILVLQGNDILSWYNDSNNSTDIYLNNCFYLIKQDEYPDNKWKFNKNSIEFLTITGPESLAEVLPEPTRKRIREILSISGSDQMPNPTPNFQNCRFCKWKTGCEHAVLENSEKVVDVSDLF